MDKKRNVLIDRVSAGEAFRRWLSDRSGLRVDLVVTRNRVSLASVRFVSERHARLRLHAAFLDAPAEIKEHIVAYLRTRRKRCWHAICAHAREIPVGPPRRIVPCCTKGHVYDLAVLADSVNRDYFDGELVFRVGWGQRGRPLRGRSIRYGSCNVETRLIRVHPALDDVRVPESFVRYILFHEMLHLVIPPERQNGRRVDHPLAFRQRERGYPAFALQKRLARELLQVLSR